MARTLTLAVAAVLLLYGCASEPTVSVKTVRVPLPVPCQEPVPARPVMPTERLGSDASIADFTRAAISELMRREGYEQQLVTALENCRAPISADGR